MVFNPSDPVIHKAKFKLRDFTLRKFRHSQEEELPGNMPEHRGLGFKITSKVDADNAADEVTRRSRTGFLVYLNSAPILGD